MDADSVPLHRLTPRVPCVQHAWISIFAPGLVLLVGILLRVGMLGADQRFHPDEALFAAQARLITEQGDILLRTTDLDKPPLTLYMTALAFKLLGPGEFAARLPNLLFSGLSLALLYALARSLYGTAEVALIAALLWALSPYDMAFAATVFTDIQATCWALVAALAATHERWRWAGLAAGLMFASKSNALLFLPLIMALGIARCARVGWRWQDITGRAWRFAWPFLLSAAALVMWDMARAPLSFFRLGYAHNDPGRLIRAAEVGPRLEQWWHWLGFMLGHPAFNALFILFGTAGLVWFHRPTRQRALDWLIVGFAAAYLGWHWLVAFPVYDRYLHTLVPFLLLLTARVILGAWRVLGKRWILPEVLGVAALGTILLFAGYQTLRGKAAIAGDQGQHKRIDVLANFLDTQLQGKTVYDHWLNWELAYYLGPSPQVQVVYMPLPEVLAETLICQPEPSYFVAPSRRQAAPWLAVLDRTFVTVSEVYQDTNNHFVVYQFCPIQDTAQNSSLSACD